MAASTTTAAEAFVDALGRRDFNRLAATLDGAVRFRALIPPGLREAASATGVVAHLRDWFDGVDALELVQAQVSEVGDRVHVSYRLRLRNGDEWQVVEQQAFCDLVGGRLARLDLLCSGFRPEGVVAEAPPTADPDAPMPAPDAVLDVPGLDCATLTPAVRTAMRELTSGQVLELRTDDPAAPDGLAAWCRLTGNELLAARGQTFYLCKK